MSEYCEHCARWVGEGEITHHPDCPHSDQTQLDEVNADA